jgi:1-acyl-sn-glycerol-3-phosphate acyltransferase
VEIRDTFLLGRITKLAGCFFVERRKVRRNADVIRQELESMKDTLNSGMNVFLFPEGTSSSGEGVLPFKNTFFQTAIDCQVPVLPLCLKYTEVNGEKFNRDNADIVCWYGDMTFPDHLFKVCLQKSITVTLVELPEMNPADYESRFAMADEAYRRINETYAKY